MTSHAQARKTLVTAWAEEHPSPKPSVWELQGVQAVALGESHYGDAYGDCRNWGSVHGGKPDEQGECPPGTLKWVDKDANGNPYETCMKCYADDVAAARHVVRLLTTKRPQTWAALRAGKSLHDVAAAMRREAYFEAPVEVYAKLLERCAASIAKSLGEPLFGASSLPSQPGTSEAGGGGGVFLLFALGVGGTLLGRKRR